MKSSTLSLALGATLLASLGGKLLANRAAPEPDQALFAARAEALLRARGYEAVQDRRPFGILVHGRKGACRVLIGDYTPYGTFADILTQRAAPVGPLRFAWRGSTYEQAPKLVPLTELYLRRELLRVGFDLPRAPIVAIAASPGCAIPDLGALASLPA